MGWVMGLHVRSFIVGVGWWVGWEPAAGWEGEWAMQSGVNAAAITGKADCDMLRQRGIRDWIDHPRYAATAMVPARDTRLSRLSPPPGISRYAQRNGDGAGAKYAT